MMTKDFKLLVRCVEEAVEYGYRRAHKHTDHPTAEGIKDAIESAVIDEICEWFYFEEFDRYERDSELH